jgi:hypothetical protein
MGLTDWGHLAMVRAMREPGEKSSSSFGFFALLLRMINSDVRALRSYRFADRPSKIPESRLVWRADFSNGLCVQRQAVRNRFCSQQALVPRITRGTRASEQLPM